MEGNAKGMVWGNERRSGRLLESNLKFERIVRVVPFEDAKRRIARRILRTFGVNIEADGVVAKPCPRRWEIQINSKNETGHLPRF